MRPGRRRTSLTTFDDKGPDRMLHHTKAFTDATQRSRHAVAIGRRPPAEHGDFERFLVAGAGAGEQSATVIRRMTRGLRATIRAYRLPTHDADDVVQSTWLSLLERHGSIREPEATEAWMRTTARRESLRIVGERHRVQPVDVDVLHDLPAPRTDRPLPEACDGEATLARSISALPEHQRNVIGMLRGEQPRSYADIAAELGVPVGSIGPTRARALERLRRDPRLAVLAPLADDG